jgi:hypothetical protein
MFETGTPVSQVTHCVTTRTHCCRRWYGMTPVVAALVLLVTTGQWPTTNMTF